MKNVIFCAADLFYSITEYFSVQWNSFAHNAQCMEVSSLT